MSFCIAWKILRSSKISRSNIFLLLESGMNKIRILNSHYVEKIDESEGTNGVWKTRRNCRNKDLRIFIIVFLLITAPLFSHDIPPKMLKCYGCSRASGLPRKTPVLKEGLSLLFLYGKTYVLLASLSTHLVFKTSPIYQFKQ